MNLNDRADRGGSLPYNLYSARFAVPGISVTANHRAGMVWVEATLPVIVKQSIFTALAG
jgi:hypothetical protein